MVWINNVHVNEEVPKDTVGGAICMCKDCVKKRRIERENKKKEKNK